MNKRRSINCVPYSATLRYLVDIETREEQNITIMMTNTSNNNIHQRRRSKSSRLLIRATVSLLVTANFFHQQQVLLMPKANNHAKIILDPAKKKGDEEVNKFYVWGDPNGINITALHSYYEWLTLEGLKRENWSWSTWPSVPVWISKDTQSGRFVVKISMAAFNKIMNAKFLFRDRTIPMLNFMVETLNQPIGNKQRQSPRRDVTRLFHLLEQGYDIPFLMDFGDEAMCGDKVFSPSSIVSPQHKLYNLHLPLFGMCRQRECNYSFPLPTYLGLRHSKVSTDEWDNYFKHSDLVYPWKNKMNAGGWRGGRTGFFWVPGRAWLLETSASAPSVIDAHLASPQSKYGISFQDFQKYKAVIDIDGNGWSGRFHGLLCMNSVVVKIRPRFFDYNAGQLKAWTHYVPYDPETVSNNIHNFSFPDFMKHILMNENKKLRDIVSNARTWCKDHMSRPSIQDDLLDIFASYVAELDKNDATWEKKWMSSFDEVLDARTFC